jgi:hypothetical protein
MFALAEFILSFYIIFIKFVLNFQKSVWLGANGQGYMIVRVLEAFAFRPSSEPI